MKMEKTYKSSLILTGIIFIFVMALFILGSASPAWSVTFTVNTTIDGLDDTLDGICASAAAGGQCTLRAAIQETNLPPGTSDSINFNIPGGLCVSPGGVCTITLLGALGALPAINDATAGTTINGYTQPGALANTVAAPGALNGTLLIEINGSVAGGVHGITITSANNIVRGLIINGFNQSSKAGVLISGGSAAGNIVAGNYLGTNSTGSSSSANYNGVHILSGGSGNTVGGTAAADRNIISGNDGNGIYNRFTDGTIIKGNYIGTNSNGTSSIANNTGLYIGNSTSVTIGGANSIDRNVISGNTGSGFYMGWADSIVIKGNYIGTNAAGSAAIPITNQNYGMNIQNSTSLIIGGTADGEENIISGNNTTGISIASTSGTVIKGNYIGTNPAGTSAIPNGQGINLYFDAMNNTIGGTVANDGNTIAYNTGDGVFINEAAAQTTDGNAISGNSIFENGGLGIDLTPNGVGVGDGTTTPNNDKAAPTVYGIEPNAGNFDVTASVTSGDTIEFFRVNNAAAPAVTADGSGYGEGFLFLGSCVDGGACTGPHVTGPDSAGAGTITATLNSSGLSAGNTVSATARDAANNTSEFGYNMTVPVVVNCQVSNTSDSGGGSLRECINYANSNPGTTIIFNIPDTDSGYTNGGSGSDYWWRITLTSGVLPQITVANTTIDGSTQAVANTKGPEIEVFGNGITGNGFYINNVSGTTIKELVINGFAGGYPNGNGIQIYGTGATQSKIYGNYIGTDAIGENAIANGFYGIHINGQFTNPNDNDIGGSVDGQGNLISGNTSGGIYINSADSNRIRGNRIGVNRVVSAKLGNGDKGINITSSINTIVGGSGAYEVNYVGGNAEGVYIDGSSTGTQVYGNVIGTGTVGTEDLGNIDYGINASIGTVGSNTQLGGLASGQGNTIANNGSEGIILQTSTGSGIRIEGNTVRDNSSRGLVINSDDVSVVKNLIYGNGSFHDGLFTGSTANATLIYHNTIHGSGNDGIEMRGTNAVIKNNVITGNGGYGVNLNGGTLSSEAYNLITDNATTPANSVGQVNGFTADSSDLSANPLYTNAAGGDFTLQNSSPAINRGCDLGGTGVDTGCDHASDEAQPDLTAGDNPNFYGFGPDQGAFENNTVTTTCVVSTTSDNVTPPYGSLRECINTANANPGTTIKCAIGSGDSGYQTSGGDNWWRISLAGALPGITANGTIIDGTSQTALDDSNNLGPEIELRGAASMDGFNIQSNNNTIRGFIINGFATSGYGAVRIDDTVVGAPGPDNNTIAGNYIGPDYNGTSAATPNVHGVYMLNGANNNTVGGTSAADRNIISGNTSYGVYIYESDTDSNTVEGNYIGTDVSGTTSLSNNYGVFISLGPQSNTIGGTTAEERNIISGNTFTGISIANAGASGNIITGNYIGTKEDGLSSLANQTGINISNSAQTNIIGGAAAGELNIISGNTMFGIQFFGANANANIVKGNYIGTDKDGSLAVPNQVGINIANGPQSNIIGGTGTNEGNTIANNTGDGITINGATSDNNLISGNSIFSNGGLGIDIFPDGVGTGSGANNDKPVPTISSVTPSGADFIISATVTSGDTIEFFRVNNAASPVVTADGSGSGEGYLFLGSCIDNDPGNCTGPHISASPDANPAAGVIQVTLLSSGLSSGDTTSATAADGTNGTSEFAVNFSTTTTTIGDGTAPSNKTDAINSIDNAVSTFTLSTDTGTDTLTALTVTFTGDDVNDVAPSGVKIYEDNGSTADEWDATDTLITNGTASFSGSTASFSSLSVNITTTSTKYLITYDIDPGATSSNTLLGAVTAATVSNTLVNNDNNDATLTVGVLDCDVDINGTYIDAENYSVLGNGFTDQTGEGISNGYLSSTTADWPGPPSLTTPVVYYMNFSQTGVYRIWLRADSSGSGANDSIWYGWNGTDQGGADFYDLGSGYYWSRKMKDYGTDPTSINVASTGAAPINIWSREAGLKFDGIYITTSTAVPSAFSGTDPQQYTGGIPPGAKIIDASICGTTTTIGDGIAPVSRDVWAGGRFFGVDAFTLQTDSGTDDLTALTITFSGTDVSDIRASGVKLWKDDGGTNNKWDVTDSFISTAAAFVGNTASFTGFTEPITTTAIQYLLTYNLVNTAASGNTLQGAVTAATVTNTLVNNDTVDATLNVEADSIYETSVYKAGYSPGALEDLFLKDTSSPATDLLNTFTMGNDYADLGAMNMPWDPDTTVTTQLSNSVVKRLQMSGRMIDAAGDSFGPTTANINFYEDRIVFDLTVNLSPNPTGTDYLFMTYGVWDDAYLDETFRWTSNNTGTYNTVNPAPNFNSGDVTAPISFQTLFELGTTDGLINATLRNISNYGTAQLKNSDPDTGAVDIAFQKVNPTIGANLQTAVVYSFETTTSGFDTTITEGRQDDFMTPATFDFGIAGGDGSGGTYSTTRGSYILDDNSSNDHVKFNFQIGGLTRYTPVFEISSWNSAAPAEIMVNGMFKILDTHYNAAVSGTTLYLQYLGNLTADAIFEIPSLCPGGVVTTTADSGAGSLRECINRANTNPGSTISFNIPTSDGGYQPDPGDGNRWWRISPGGVLPPITANGTIIDGLTQTTNQGDTNALGPEIEINGASAGSVDGFRITSNNNTIRGFIINSFISVSRAGVIITGASAFDNTVTGSYIGTNYAGTVADGNDRGVFIVSGAQTNTIGGDTQAERNVISGNNYGFYLTSSDTDSNIITGNFIGTNASGTAALPNNTYGIYMTNGPGSNFIGGTTNDERNIISGNSTTSGIFITGAGSDANVVRGNYIGTDVNGTAAVPNKIGITIGSGAQSNIIGGNTSGERNIIAGSDNQQIVISGTNTRIEGNNIGADLNGAAMGGAFHVVQINITATGTIVQRNLIRDAAGAYSGINVGADTALIYHNTIDSNGGNGVIVSSGVSGTIIRSNILSNNGQWGVRDNDLGSSTINTHNLYFNNTTDTCNYSCFTAGTYNVSGDPKYVGGDDYTLTECTSPAINMACDLGNAGDDTFCDSAADGAQPDMNEGDLNNFNNNAPDMGAFETSNCDPNLSIVKQVWEINGTAPLVTPVTAPTGSTLVFLMYVKNPTTGQVTDLRFVDNLDDTAFDYVEGSLIMDDGSLTDASSDKDIFDATASGTGTPLSDAVDANIASGCDVSESLCPGSSMDKMTVGAVVGQANTALNINNNSTFAIRFEVKVK